MYQKGISMNNNDFEALDKIFEQKRMFTNKRNSLFKWGVGIWIGSAMVGLVLTGLVTWVVVHFIAKFW